MVMCFVLMKRLKNCSMSHKLKKPKSNPAQANDKTSTQSNHTGIANFSRK